MAHGCRLHPCVLLVPFICVKPIIIAPRILVRAFVVFHCLLVAFVSLGMAVPVCAQCLPCFVNAADFLGIFRVRSMVWIVVSARLS